MNRDNEIERTLEAYKRVDYGLPRRALTWWIHGKGLGNFGRNRKAEEVPLQPPGPDQLLARVDAVGICFSDVKLINAGADHPRIKGRDLSKNPTTPGHEVSLTIVDVGENLKDEYKVGERFIVQADIYYKGVGIAYGYAIPGGMAQYTVLGPEVLNGDGGCYLIPVKPETGYSEAALTEPWACVVASYHIEQRNRIKPDGLIWFVGTGEGLGNYTINEGVDERSHPRRIVASGVDAKLRSLLERKAKSLKIPFVERNDVDFGEIAREETGGAGFDDIIAVGARDVGKLERAAKYLARDGVMNIVAREEAPTKIEIDVGRIHYEHLFFIGNNSSDLSSAYRGKYRPDLKAGGIAWFVGGAGPMGQMHVQRSIDKRDGPGKVVITDLDSSRLEVVRRRFEARAKSKGIEFVLLNPRDFPSEGAFYERISQETSGRGFDDIVALVPVPAVISRSAEYLAEGGLMNIFAGVPVGTMAKLDPAGIYRRGHRFVGMSGSAIEDLRFTLSQAEDKELLTNYSVAAIGGINAVWEGIEAVQKGRFPGKIVIYPQIEDLPLTAVEDIPKVMPKVGEKLEGGNIWTKEAERELLGEKLKDKILGG
ncbi:MAG: alcohol dehydrogenase catalytic domain-containing protein [bacterium]